MEKAVIYFNSRCSTCRKTLAILEDHPVNFEIKEYLKDPPTASETLKIMGILGDKAPEIVRTKEALYKSEPFSLTNQEVVAEKLSLKPTLIQRPIVIYKGRAVVARPPEEVLNILI